MEILAYLLPLSVPLLLLLDVVTSWWHGRIVFGQWNSNVVIAGLSAGWLIAALGSLALSKDRKAFVRRTAKPLISLYICYLMLFLLEGLLHWVTLTPPIPGLGARKIIAHTYMNPSIYPGISGTKAYTTNELGLRGPAPPRNGAVYKIMAIGGSTTQCTNLDDSEEWPQLLMDYLNASQHNQSVWVGNAGVSGFTTVHHTVLLQWLPGILHPDMVVFLFGVNDLLVSLNHRGAPTQALLEGAAGFEGNLPPGTHRRAQYPLFRRLRIVLLLRTAADNLQQRLNSPRSLPMRDLAKVRKLRADSPVIPLPDMSTALSEYRTRVLVLASQCRALEVRCLFLTQPVIWRDGLSREEQSLLWTGSAGLPDPQVFYSAGDLARAMDMYNHTLLSVCQQSDLECYDLASHIPKNTSAFFDDMHFNEAGARLVARNLTEYLLSTPPFERQTLQRQAGLH